MRFRTSSTALRTTIYMLLLALLLGTGVSTPAQAAPAIQGSAPAAVGDHLVTNINLGPDSPNILANGQDVTLSFSYSTTEANGVQIFARPFSDGALSPSYAASGSPLYPQSATGSGTGSFTITSGQVVVDQIRFQMYNADQSTLLFETFIPVYYLFSNSSHVVTNVFMTADTPDVLAFDQNINFRFNYSTQGAGNVRIFLRPFTNGALTPNYAAHGSQAYETGSGSGTGYFTILSGQVVVDQVRVQMYNASQTTLLFEAFLPVYYRFRSSTNSVTNIEFNPDTPNVFKYGQNVNLTFNYTTNEEGGVRIFARPFSGAGLSPNYAAHGSPLYSVGSGGATGSFNLTAGPSVVDKVRIQMWNANQTKLLFEAFLPVYLFWAGSGPPPGPNMSVDGIEVTQAVQDLNNSVDLVAGKRTYVRVHVSSPVNTAHVFATLSGKRGVVNLAPTLNPGNPGSDITVRTTPNREQINDSFWFELPSGWTAAGNLTLTARLDPNNAKNDLVQANNVRTVTVNFKSTPPLRLRLMNVQYRVGSTTYLANSSHMNALESWLRRAYPISSLQVTRQTFVYPFSGLPNVDTLNGLMALSKVFRVIFNGEDSRVVYYGMVDDGGGFMRGKAAGIPGTIASGPTGSGTFGWDFDGTYGDWYGGHEIGHTRGRYHAEFCGAGGGAAYPYPGGRISPDLTGNGALYGFDITTRAIYGPTWKDVMTYCSNQWVSDFTYEGIRARTVAVGTASTQPSATADKFLIVSGRADLEAKTATLENVSLIQQSNTAPLPETGDWLIALVGGSNNDLATYPFAPDELSDAEGAAGMPAIIAEAVPWSEGATRVEIRYNGKVVASRSASANPPSVNLTAPADSSSLPNGPFQVAWSGSDPDGNALTYSLLYSNDGGQNWQPLAANLQGTSVELNGSQLPGGTGLLRVVASDGFYSAQDTSGTLTVPLHAPSVQIVLPEANQVFFPTQQVQLQGTGYDLEDGTLGDAAFEWSSNIDGVLGNGANLSTSELSTGTHIITLKATDSNGQTSQVTRTITIAQEGTPEATTLAVAPFAVGITVPLGSGPVQQTLSLRSSSDTEFSWTASENAPWLTLGAATGQTPNDMTITVDPSKLHAGSYSTTITFTSGQAGNSPVVVPITVQVVGYAYHIPLVQRTP